MGKINAMEREQLDELVLKLVEAAADRGDDHVRIYSCGPTVYDYPHVGHLRTAVVIDVLRRWLEAGHGVKSTLVSNLTDIDDKIVQRAIRDGVDWRQLGTKYGREYDKALEALDVSLPDVQPIASGWVHEMGELIQRLLNRGHAYIGSDGSIWFSVASLDSYGSLTRQAGQSTSSTEAKASLTADDESHAKRDPRDFALWKRASGDDLKLGSYWNLVEYAHCPDGSFPELSSDSGVTEWEEECPDSREHGERCVVHGYSIPGRPGWHTECVAMSLGVLGDGFDLHAGGVDLRFPHHENELAQAAATGHEFAENWLHVGWVTRGGEKMSKSKGNGLSAEDAIIFPGPWATRYLLLSAKPTSPLELPDRPALRAPDKTRKRILDLAAAERELYLSAGLMTGDDDESIALRGSYAQSGHEATGRLAADSETAAIITMRREELESRFAEAMDAMATPEALAVLHAAIDLLGDAIKTGDAVLAHEAMGTLSKQLNVLGLDPSSKAYVEHYGPIAENGARRSTGESKWIEAASETIRACRADRRWEASDAVRSVAIAAGYQVHINRDDVQISK